MLPGICPELQMGLPAQFLPSRSWFMVWGEEWGESCQPLCPLSGCFFVGLFLSFIPLEGVWVSFKQGCHRQVCAQKRMPNARTLEGAGTRGKEQSPFISDGNLGKK